MQSKRAGARRRGQFHIEIDHGTCVDCAGCVSICPTEALHMQALTLNCHDADCIGCDLCVRFCPVVALELHTVQPQPQPSTSAASA